MAEVMPVDFLLVDLIQDRDLAAVKAEPPTNPVQSFIIGHVAGIAAGDTLDQSHILRMGNLLAELVRLPFQLFVELCPESGQLALIFRAVLLDVLV